MVASLDARRSKGWQCHRLRGEDERGDEGEVLRPVGAVTDWSGFYNPTADAAFWLNKLPSRMYRLNTVMLLWPVVCAMTRSWTPSPQSSPTRHVTSS
jgi:hypothetical protein